MHSQLYDLLVHFCCYVNCLIRLICQCTWSLREIMCINHIWKRDFFLFAQVIESPLQHSNCVSCITYMVNVIFALTCGENLFSVGVFDVLKFTQIWQTSQMQYISWINSEIMQFVGENYLRCYKIYKLYRKIMIFCFFF